MLSDSPSSPLLRVENAGYVWRTLHTARRALQDVSAEFRPGGIHFICGPSGSGKSTLGLLLSGLLPPTEGKITLDGGDLIRRRDRIACVFQFPESLFFADTVEEELADISGNGEEITNPRAFELLGISYNDLKHRNPHLLSEGYARLTAIALQLSRNPDVTILDEPTIGLDWKHQERVIEALRSRQNSSQITVVITHDLDLLQALGGISWMLNDGTLAWNGPTRQLVEDASLLRQHGLLA